MENEISKLKTWNEEELVELEAKLINSVKENVLKTNRNKRIYDYRSIVKSVEDFNKTPAGQNVVIYNSDDKPIQETTLYPRIVINKNQKDVRFISADIDWNNSPFKHNLNISIKNN